jgi:hypothetical protein
MEKMKEITDLAQWMTSGGCVLGAATYFAKAILGSNPIAFMGADFSFDYKKKFHAWDSKYDKDIGQAMRCVDVWGMKRLTWPSYWNFKCYFDWFACTVPGIYINCSEGGLMGAYPEGNIKQIKQMLLKDFLRMYNLVYELNNQMTVEDHRELKVLY